VFKSLRMTPLNGSSYHVSVSHILPIFSAKFNPCVLEESRSSVTTVYKTLTLTYNIPFARKHVLPNICSLSITYFQRFKLSDITLKTTENGAIRQNAHDFLLVFYLTIVCVTIVCLSCCNKSSTTTAGKAGRRVAKVEIL